ncbi:hypothetical protein ACIGZJ_36145 [Kitasatospora sp. NPDC052868]|uniref:hypothetical protein n=1 Tax=Kitasatospora sp. NPDC052868 TaxID=3364060 RepID=UPI0037CB2343
MSEQTTTLQQQCLQDYQRHQASQADNQSQGAVNGQLGNAVAHGNAQAGAMGSSLAPGVGNRY